jgi:hypothetical protein
MKESLSLLMVDNGLDIYGGPLHGTEYSLDEACKRCGTGAHQTGPLVLRPFKPQKQEIFYTLNNELLVSPRVAETLQAAGFRCVGKVLSSPSREVLPILQLVPEATLPRFLPETTGVTRERPCPECDRDGYFGIAHVPMRLRYRSLGPSSAGLFATFERFGNSRLRSPFKDSVFAPPMYVASERLASTLSGLKLEGLSFETADVG